MKPRSKTAHTHAHDEPKPVEAESKPLAPTVEQIQARAHELYLARGGEPGHDWDDWLLAESQIQAELAQQPQEPPTKTERS